MKSNLARYFGGWTLLFLLLFIGCDKTSDFIPKAIDLNLANQNDQMEAASVVQSVKADGGKAKIRLSIEIVDPLAARYRISWDRDKGVRNGFIGEPGLLELLIGNLEEGIHDFEIQILNKDEEILSINTVRGKAYGDKYAASLHARSITQMRWTGDNQEDIEITWETAVPSLAGGELIYEDNAGEQKSVKLSADKTDEIKKISQTGVFNYVSYFLPEPEALDAFKTSPVEVDIDAFIAANSSGDLNLSFSTKTEFGAQDDQLSVLVSTDFNGKYNIGDIEKATWIDITDNFEYSPLSSKQTVPAGELALDNYSNGNPIYIAYRYTNLPETEAGKPRWWYVQNFKVVGKDESIVADYGTAQFNITIEGTLDPDRIDVSSELIFKGNNNSKDKGHVIWAITKAIQP